MFSVKFNFYSSSTGGGLFHVVSFINSKLHSPSTS